MKRSFCQVSINVGWVWIRGRSAIETCKEIFGSNTGNGVATGWLNQRSRFQYRHGAAQYAIFQDAAATSLQHSTPKIRICRRHAIDGKPLRSRHRFIAPSRCVVTRFAASQREVMARDSLCSRQAPKIYAEPIYVYVILRIFVLTRAKPLDAVMMFEGSFAQRLLPIIHRPVMD